LRKLPAASRIASAVISGWPDDPDSPLHSGADDGAAGAAAAGGAVVPVLPVVAGLRLNSERMSKPWPSTGTVNAVAARTAAAKAHIDREILAILLCSGGRWARLWGTYMVAGPLTTVIAPPMRLRPPCCLNRLSAAVGDALSVHDAFRRGLHLQTSAIPRRQARKLPATNPARS
jgi:hypothetical protein